MSESSSRKSTRSGDAESQHSGGASKRSSQRPSSARPSRKSQKVEEEEILGEEFPDDNVRHIHEIREVEGNLDSPIDINLTYTTPIPLPPLVWYHMDDVPKKMKVTNSGHTLIVSAKWYQERPFVIGGPLVGNYVFSQLHFHWGKDNMEGSEHTVDGFPMPLEMHVVHFKSAYLTQEAALRQKDGVCIFVFFFNLQAASNTGIQPFVDQLPNVQEAHNSIKLLPALPLSYIFKAFTADYFLYWGTVTTHTCVHSILWIISRETVAVSMEQMDAFRTLLDINDEPLMRNFRSLTNIKKDTNYHVYHGSPSTNLYSTLLYFPQEEVLVTRGQSNTSGQYRCDKVLTNSPFRVSRYDFDKLFKLSLETKKKKDKAKAASKRSSKSSKVALMSCFDRVSDTSISPSK